MVKFRPSKIILHVYSAVAVVDITDRFHDGRRVGVDHVLVVTIFQAMICTPFPCDYLPPRTMVEWMYLFIFSR